MFTEVCELMMQWLVVSDLSDQVNLKPMQLTTVEENVCVLWLLYLECEKPIAGSVIATLAGWKS